MVFSFGSLWVVKARQHDGLGLARTAIAAASAAAIRGPAAVDVAARRLATSRG